MSFFVILKHKSTPIAFLEFNKNEYYQKQIRKLKKTNVKDYDLVLIDSIVELAFTYKDWETSIDYSEKQ